MSEEERMIKYVEEIVEDSINNIEGKDYFEYIMTMNDIQAIQGLLDLYNKEKEKNKELEEKKKKQGEHINNINKRNSNQRTQLKLLQQHRLKKYIMSNYIEKSKVREILDTKYIAMFEGDTEFPDDATIMKTVKYVKVSDIEELLQEGDAK